MVEVEAKGLKVLGLRFRIWGLGFTRACVF